MNRLLRILKKSTQLISVRNMLEHLVIINVKPKYGGFYRLSYNKTHSSKRKDIRHLLEKQAVKVKKVIYCKVFGLIVNYLNNDAKEYHLIMVA